MKDWMKVDPFLQIKKLKHPQELSRQQKSEVDQVGPRAKQSLCHAGRGQPILASAWEWGPSVSRSSYFLRNARNLDFYLNSPDFLENFLDFLMLETNLLF